MKKYKNVVEWAQKLGSIATTTEDAKKYLAARFYPTGFQLVARSTAIDARRICLMGKEIKK